VWCVFFNKKSCVNQNLIKKWIDLVLPVIGRADGKKIHDVGFLQGAHSKAI